MCFSVCSAAPLPHDTSCDGLFICQALAWCPWQTNLLVSGGGSGDRHLRFWNAHNGVCVKAVDTKSQVSGNLDAFCYTYSAVTRLTY